MRQRMFINRFLIILAAAERLAMCIQHFKSKHLKGWRSQSSEFGHVRIFLMREDQLFLGEVLSYIPH